MSDPRKKGRFNASIQNGSTVQLIVRVVIGITKCSILMGSPQRAMHEWILLSRFKCIKLTPE